MIPVLNESENRCEHCNRIGCMFFLTNQLVKLGNSSYQCNTYSCSSCRYEQNFLQGSNGRLTGINRQTGELVYL